MGGEGGQNKYQTFHYGFLAESWKILLEIDDFFLNDSSEVIDRFYLFFPLAALFTGVKCMNDAADAHFGRPHVSLRVNCDRYSDAICLTDLGGPLNGRFPQGPVPHSVPSVILAG